MLAVLTADFYVFTYQIFHSILFWCFIQRNFLNTLQAISSLQKTFHWNMILIGKRQHSKTNTNSNVIHQAIRVVVCWCLSLSGSSNEIFTPIRSMHAYKHHLLTHTYSHVSTLRQLTNDVRKIRCVILDLTFECSVFIAQRS